MYMKEKNREIKLYYEIVVHSLILVEC